MWKMIIPTTLCLAAVSLTSTPGLAAPARGQAVSPLPAPRHELLPGGLPRPWLAPEAPKAAAPKPFPADYPVADQARWTVMVYVAGDNDLEPYVVSDIETEMGLVGSNRDVQVVVMADRAPGYANDGGDWQNSLLFHVEQDQKATVAASIADLGERNMGDPTSLVDFVDWSQTHFPAQRYALVFWDHGWGWRPGQSLVDETNGDTLDLDEMITAMDQVGRVDVVGFDACLMQNIEVQAAFRNYTDVLVASQDYVSGRGFAYEEVLADMQNVPLMGVEDVAIHFSQSMTDRTISAVVLDERWDNLQAAVDRWAVSLQAALATERDEMNQAWRSTQRFGDWAYLDLYDMAYQISIRSSDPGVITSSWEVMNGVEGVILHEWHRDVYYGSDTHGISIYMPTSLPDRYVRYTPDVDDFDWYVDRLDFASDTRWDEFLMDFSGR